MNLTNEVDMLNFKKCLLLSGNQTTMLEYIPNKEWQCLHNMLIRPGVGLFLIPVQAYVSMREQGPLMRLELMVFCLEPNLVFR